MKTPRLRVVVLCLVLAALSLAAVRSASWGQEPNKPSELAVKIGQLCREKKLDEAVALVRAKAAEKSPTAEVPRLMFGLGRTLYFNGRNEEALSLLKDVAERFPMSDVATSAWLGVGNVHAAMMNRKEMIAAYERGLDVSPGRSRVYPVDGSGLYSSACESLGHHYIESEQWDKGLQINLDWAPTSFCGSCHWEMEADRANNIVLCLIQLQRFDEAAQRSWRAFIRSGLGDNHAAGFLLVRLYAEAGQLNDLAAQCEDLARKFADDSNAAMLERKASQLKDGITVARSERLGELRRALAPANERKSVKTNVAAWLIERDHKPADRLRADGYLISIQSPRLYESWPKPENGSLPKTLPADLLTVKREP